MSERPPTQQQNRPLRALLPAAKKHDILGPTAMVSRLAKPANTAAACDACRKHKTKCSGDRPACRRCAQRHIPCHYAARPGETESQAIRRGYRDLRDRASEHEEIVALLRDLSEPDALNVLRRMRAGTGLSDILNQVRAGDVLMQMAVAPETRFRYTFPYRGEMPAGCLGGDNPYLQSIIYEVASALPSPSVAASPAVSIESSLMDENKGTDSSSARKSGSPSGTSADADVVYLSPFHAATLYEPRLTDIKIAPWTNVCDDEAVMRELLEIFFRCEYQFTSAFHKDYFLDDLATGNADFCSPLLVNLVLAYASVCNPKLPKRSEYWNPETLAYRFLAEARRIWELVACEPHITTVQAGILFSVFYNLSGLDEIGQAYRIHGVELAKHLGILNGPNENEPARIQRGKAFTAWTLYNWEALIAFSFMRPSPIKEVPNCPLPDPSEDPDWYGQFWVRYPSSATLTSMSFGAMFKSKTEFRIIMNEFCEDAYATTLGVTVFKAEGLRRKLEYWFNHLPESLHPRNIVLPAQLQLHMYYHHLLLTIYEPLLDAVAPYPFTPQIVVAASRKYMHTLIRLYFLRHGYEAMDLFIVIPLMVVAEECLEQLGRGGGSEAAREELRSTIILIAKGLHDQRRNHYLAEALFRVLRNRLQKRDLLLLRRALGTDVEQEDEPQKLAQAVRSHWPVGVVKKKEELENLVLRNLVENYGQLSVEEDDDDVLGDEAGGDGLREQSRD